MFDINKILTNVIIHKKMRQLKIPLTITTNEIGTKLIIVARFNNCALNFTSTYKTKMQEEAISFIEEANDKYKISQNYNNT